MQGVAIVTGKGGLCALPAAKGCARAEREEQVQVTAAVPSVTGFLGGRTGRAWQRGRRPATRRLAPADQGFYRAGRRWGVTQGL